MSDLRLFLGQRFKSHTFQVIFDPLKDLKAATIQKTIKVYLKDCPREVSEKKPDLLCEGFQSLCTLLSESPSFDLTDILNMKFLKMVKGIADMQSNCIKNKIDLAIRSILKQI